VVLLQEVFQRPTVNLLARELPSYRVPTSLTVAVLGLALFTIYLVLGGAARLMDRLRDEVGPRFLEEKTPTLLDWDWSRALEDLSSLTRRRGQSSGLQGGRSHLRGTVQSLDRRRDAWMAYTVDTQRRNGMVKIRTSASSMDIHIRQVGGPLPGRHAMVVMDEVPMGSYSFETREIFTPRGQRLGQLAGGLRILTQGMTNYRELELGGQVVAEINFEPFSPLEHLGPMPPFFRPRLQRLSQDEQWWLLAMLGIALYEDSLSPDI
jgi:hypothetical protein